MASQAPCWLRRRALRQFSLSLQRSGRRHGGREGLCLPPPHIFAALPVRHCASTSSQTGAVEELAVRLRDDPALCTRVAAAVDADTAVRWAEARAVAREQEEIDDGATVPRPKLRQLKQLFVRSAVPFIGFGFFDNMIMLTVGEAIDCTLGAALGLSTLAAAGFGQMASDSCGITLQGLIERFADRLGLPDPKLTAAQLRLSHVNTILISSRILGIVFGCGLGMFPLLLMPDKSPRLVDQISEKLPTATRMEFLSLVTTKTYNDGEKLLEVGKSSDFVNLIQSGEVICVGRDAGGGKFTVCTIGPGHAFGRPELHDKAKADIVAQGTVVVQQIKKDDFVRLTGSAGIEAFEQARKTEHMVYLASKSDRRKVRHIDSVREESNSGKTRTFANLPQEEKLEVLRLISDEEGGRRFEGKPREGKVAYFAQLPDRVKYEALLEWRRRKREGAIRSAEIR